MAVEELLITNARPEHAGQIQQLTALAYHYPADACMPAESIAQHIRHFPEGQFVALNGAQVTGFAVTMRTDRSPTAIPLRWSDAIGGPNRITNHRPDGDWLYGIDFVVHPDYRRQGIGTRLYRARFKLVRRLNLRGFYAGGMLMGFRHYCDQMTLEAYAQKVRSGEIRDPTVSMQMGRGFKAKAVIPCYGGNRLEKDSAMLIVWENSDYRRVEAEELAGD